MGINGGMEEENDEKKNRCFSIWELDAISKLTLQSMCGSNTTSSASTVTKAYACTYGGTFLFIRLNKFRRGSSSSAISNHFCPLSSPATPPTLHTFLLQSCSWHLLPMMLFRFPFTTSTRRFSSHIHFVLLFIFFLLLNRCRYCRSSRSVLFCTCACCTGVWTTFGIFVLFPSFW